MMMTYKPFIDTFGTFIDGQLSSVYQLLESRLIPESDDDLIRIAFNFSKNADMPMENLLRSVADYRGFFDEVSMHSNEILELLNQVVLKSARVFKSAEQSDAESIILVKKYAAEIFNLGEVMMIEAAKALSSGDIINQKIVNSAALACQIIIQVEIC